MPDRPEVRYVSGVGLLIRLYWMLFGNSALLILALFIATHKYDMLLVASLAYFAIIVSMVVVRYVDIRFFNGETVDGRPATMEHWRRYAMIIAIAGLAAWLVALAIARFSG